LDDGLGRIGELAGGDVAKNLAGLVFFSHGISVGRLKGGAAMEQLG
jgi:hypothetical protein